MSLIQDIQFNMNFQKWTRSHFFVNFNQFLNPLNLLILDQLIQNWKLKH